MKEALKMSEKQMKVLGWVATFMSVMMYVSYFPQIMNNLAGQKGKRYPSCSSQCTRDCFWPSNGYHGFDLKGTEKTGFQSSFFV